MILKIQKPSLKIVVHISYKPPQKKNFKANIESSFWNQELINTICYPFNWIWILSFIEYQWQGLLEIQYLMHLASKNYKITSIRSYSSSTLQEYKKHAPISFIL